MEADKYAFLHSPKIINKMIKDDRRREETAVKLERWELVERNRREKES